MEFDNVFSIQTTIWKSPDEPRLTEVKVTCCPLDNGGETDLASPIAYLRGFILDIGYYPSARDGFAFEAFDMRSGHAYDTFRIITKRRPMIKRALPRTDVEMIGSFLHLERLKVGEEYRGQELGLRLLREARQTLARFGMLAVLKAHPDGKDTTPAQNIRLGQYYQSDRVCEFAPISDRSEPGWLVADWSDPGPQTKDEYFWSSKRHEIAASGEPAS